MSTLQTSDDIKAECNERPCPKPPPEQTVAPPPPQPTVLRSRTQDVTCDATSFRELMVPEPMIRSLASVGFERPSPVQKAAIPLGLVGTDLIVQAKSGTGKTVVFAVICLERVKAQLSRTQALILAPTREIAIQGEQVIRKLVSELPPPLITSAVFVGGLPIVDDEKKLRRLVHVAVGTPGRVSALLQSGRLIVDCLSVLVLDEADCLLGDGFYEEVTCIYDQLPRRKQVLAFSATFTPELLADLEPLMRRPQRIMMCAESVSLLGVKQFYALVPAVQLAPNTSSPSSVSAIGASGGGSAGNVDDDDDDDDDDGACTEAGGKGQVAVASGARAGAAAPAVFREKVQQLLRLLAGVSFHQAAVFCNHKPRAEWLAEQLNTAGYPAAYLSGDRAQTERMEAMEAVKGFKLRVVVSTDVMARGVDLERVNLVVNLDLPYDAATYMHRVGRTGRFGSRGVCVSYVTEAELALLASYVDDQTAVAGATAAAAITAAAANGGSAENGEGTVAGGAVCGAKETLLPLPEFIPEDLYDYELGMEWERQALQKLLRKGQQKREQYLDLQQQQPEGVVAEAGSAVATTPLKGDSEMTVKGGAVSPHLPLSLPDLPPLPEEIEAARKAHQTAQAAAKKAEKALRKQQALQTQQQEAAAQQQASWAAHNQSEYYGAWHGANGGYGCDYGRHLRGGATPSACDTTWPVQYRNPDPWAAYSSEGHTAGYVGVPPSGAHGYQDYRYHSSPNSHYAGYDAYGAYSPVSQQQGEAAVTSIGTPYNYHHHRPYYRQGADDREGVSIGRGSQGPPTGASAGYWSYPYGAPASSATATIGDTTTAAANKTELSAGEGAKGSSKPTPLPQQVPQQPRDGLRWEVVHSGDTSDEGKEEENTSELSFSLLRGEAAVRREAPAVLRCSGGASGRRGWVVASGEGMGGSPGSSVPDSPTVEGVAGVELAEVVAGSEGDVEEEAGVGEDEEYGWVFRDVEFSAGAAKVVDNLVVSLPPPQQQQQGKQQQGCVQSQRSSCQDKVGGVRGGADASVSSGCSAPQRGTHRREGAASGAGAAAVALPGGNKVAAAPSFSSEMTVAAAGVASRGGVVGSAAQWPKQYGPSPPGGHGLSPAYSPQSWYSYNNWQSQPVPSVPHDNNRSGVGSAEGWAQGAAAHGPWSGRGQEPDRYAHCTGAGGWTQGYSPNYAPPAYQPHHHQQPHPYYHHNYHHGGAYYHYDHYRHPYPPYYDHYGGYGSYSGYPAYCQQQQYQQQRDWYDRGTGVGGVEQGAYHDTLREYVRQQHTWHQAYTTWYEQYKRWHEECYQEE